MSSSKGLFKMNKFKNVPARTNSYNMQRRVQSYAALPHIRK
jgi:hypothetical protein